MNLMNSAHHNETLREHNTAGAEILYISLIALGHCILYLLKYLSNTLWKLACLALILGLNFALNKVLIIVPLFVKKLLKS